MYNNKLAVAILNNGQVLRERGDTVYLPFGSEYAIRVKNLNTTKASVKVEIDGKEATEGVALIIDPNESFDLERFIKNGNLNQGNRFKFIQRTAAVARHRGVSIDDGLIRVTFQFERPYVRPSTWPWVERRRSSWTLGGTPYGRRSTDNGRSSWTAGGLGSSGSSYSASASNSVLRSKSSTVYDGDAQCSLEPDPVGVTAAGSVSDQQFQVVSSLNLDPQEHVMVLRLLGESAETKIKVTKPLTVKSKPKCSSCGLKCKSSWRSCPRCSTSLEIV